MAATLEDDSVLLEANGGNDHILNVAEGAVLEAEGANEVIIPGKALAVNTIQVAPPDNVPSLKDKIIGAVKQSIFGPNREYPSACLSALLISSSRLQMS